jgi:hypothetical protein
MLDLKVLIEESDTHAKTIPRDLIHHLNPNFGTTEIGSSACWFAIFSWITSACSSTDSKIRLLDDLVVRNLYASHSCN